MSKKNKDEKMMETVKMEARNPLNVVSSYVKKNGKIKAENKKKTKLVKGMCPHHQKKRNGKIVPTITGSSASGMGRCKICDALVPIIDMSQERENEIINSFRDLNNQAKFLATATDAGREAESYFASVGVNLVNYNKNFRKVKESAERKDVMNKKKNKKNKSNKYTTEFGSWG